VNFRLCEIDAKLAQKLGQLQPFLAFSSLFFPQECVANLHLVGQPNTFLAQAVRPPAHAALPGGVGNRRGEYERCTKPVIKHHHAPKAEMQHTHTASAGAAGQNAD
jgi:hypothetical protein